MRKIFTVLIILSFVSRDSLSCMEVTTGGPVLYELEIKRNPKEAILNSLFEKSEETAETRALGRICSSKMKEKFPFYKNFIPLKNQEIHYGEALIRITVPEEGAGKEIENSRNSHAPLSFMREAHVPSSQEIKISSPKEGSTPSSYSVKSLLENWHDDKGNILGWTLAELILPWVLVDKKSILTLMGVNWQMRENMASYANSCPRSHYKITQQTLPIFSPSLELRRVFPFELDNVFFKSFKDYQLIFPPDPKKGYQRLLSGNLFVSTLGADREFSCINSDPSFSDGFYSASGYSDVKIYYKPPISNSWSFMDFNVLRVFWGGKKESKVFSQIDQLPDQETLKESLMSFIDYLKGETGPDCLKNQGLTHWSEVFPKDFRYFIPQLWGLHEKDPQSFNRIDQNFIALKVMRSIEKDPSLLPLLNLVLKKHHLYKEHFYDIIYYRSDINNIYYLFKKLKKYDPQTRRSLIHLITPKLMKSFDECENIRSYDVMIHLRRMARIKNENIRLFLGLLLEENLHKLSMPDGSWTFFTEWVNSLTERFEPEKVKEAISLLLIPRGFFSFSPFHYDQNYWKKRLEIIEWQIKPDHEKAPLSEEDEAIRKEQEFQEMEEK